MPSIQEIIHRTLRVASMILCKASLYDRMYTVVISSILPLSFLESRTYVTIAVGGARDEQRELEVHKKGRRV